MDTSVKKLYLVLAFVIFPATVLAQSPNSVIQSAADELARQLDGNKETLAADKQALYITIDGILLPRFDRRYAAQLVLGRHWRDATAGQRDQFIDVFYNSLVRRYADGVLEFDQNRIEILPFRGDDSKPRTQVRTIVTLDNGTKVPVNYGLVRRKSGWLIFDVTIEGISYVRNFRTELNSEVRSTSLNAMITRLKGEAVATAE